MRVLIAGGQGVVGRRVVRRLAGDGVEVLVPVAGPNRAPAAVMAGAVPVRVDLADRAARARVVSDVDVVVNLTGEIPRPSRAWRSSAWVAADRAWRETPRWLVAAMSDEPGGRMIHASTTLLYADGGDRWIDEEWPLALTRVTEGAAAAEEQVGRLAGAGAVGVTLRLGPVYSADSEATRSTLRAARRGLGNTVGSNDGYVSMIHADDAAAAVIAAMDAPTGVYNVVENEPGTKLAQMDCIAAALGISRLNSTGAAIAALGGSRTRAMGRSHRVSNRLFRDVTGWSPRYVNEAEGWAEVVVAAHEGAGSGF